MPRDTLRVLVRRDTTFVEKMAAREFDWAPSEVEDERAAIEPIRQRCQSNPCLPLGTDEVPWVET